MKNQALFPSKDKRKKIKMSSAAIFVLSIRVHIQFLLSFLQRSAGLLIVYPLLWTTFSLS